MNDFIVKEKFFQENVGSVNLKKGMLLLDPKKEEEFSNQELTSKLKNLTKTEVIFSPSLYTEWKNETLYFKDIK